MPETTTPTRWVFDAYSAFRDSYEESLLRESESEAIAECFSRTVAGLAEDPILDDFVTVGEEKWYVASGGGFQFRDEDIAKYLLVYRVDATTNPGRIFPLVVCKASAIGRAEDRSREVVRLIERTLTAVTRRKVH